MGGQRSDLRGAGRRGRRGRRCHEQRGLGLDDSGEARLVVGELQEERLQLIPIQLGEQLRHGATRLDLVGMIARGQQDGDDVLAPATPVIRAGAGRTDRAVSGEGDLDSVGVDVGPPDVRLEQRATLNQRGDGPAPVVLAAPLERVGRGVGTDGGIRVARQAHGGPRTLRRSGRRPPPAGWSTVDYSAVSDGRAFAPACRRRLPSLGPGGMRRCGAGRGDVAARPTSSVGQRVRMADLLSE
jgi:hypothetical protein